LKHLRTHFEAKHEKSVGTPILQVPATLHPWRQTIILYEAFEDDQIPLLR